MEKRKNAVVGLCHSIPGRMRIKVKAAGGKNRPGHTIQTRLKNLDGILKVDIRPVTGSIILIYDAETIDPRQLIAQIDRQIISTRRLISAPAHDSPLALNPEHSRGRGSAAKTFYLLNVLALGGFLCFALVRRLFFKSPLSQGPLSLSGVVAAVGALPLLYRTIGQLRTAKRTGLYPFLSLGCGLAILLGEALTALEIIWLTALGMYTEEYVSQRARRTIQEMLHVLPAEANCLKDGGLVLKPLSAIKSGDTVVVYAGDPIPVDGTVLSGEALVDEAHITGRSQPELRQADDWVYAGTRLQGGRLLVRADRLGAQTYLCRIRHMVDDSLGKRGQIDKRADALAMRLTRLGIAATVATFLITRNLTRSFAVMLVMSCPCATVLAASTAIAAAIANAARHHILVKGGLYLEQVSQANHICFDKTGTITHGVPSVRRVVSRRTQDNGDDIIRLAASAEAGSNHPVAAALIKEAHGRGLAIEAVREYEGIIGRGVRARCGSDQILVGNEAFMLMAAVDVSEFHRQAREWMQAGETVLFVARNGQVQGMIALANNWRPAAPAVLRQLRRCGFEHTSLISGDTRQVVASMASRMGFDDYRSEYLPEEKSRYVASLEASGQRLMMVGDGVNDALALSKATVGVAMGAGGSEVAIEAADIALLNNDLESLVVLRQLSHQTLKTIEYNFWLATTTNIIGILMGAFGRLPTLMTAILHVGHTFLILLNSSRLLFWEAPRIQAVGPEPAAKEENPSAGDLKTSGGA